MPTSAGSNSAYPFGSPQPGANFGGSQQAVPSPAGGSTPAVGGATNPFTPSVPGGASQPGNSSPYNPGAANGLNVAQNSGLQTSGSIAGQGAQNQFMYAMQQAGYGAGVAQQLWNFLQNGAGYNQQAVQAQWNALQPQMKQDQAQLAEQFGAEGLGNSSPAAYGMATLDSQYLAQFQGMMAQQYEQSVQNYMNVLLGGKFQPFTAQGTGAVFNQVASGISSLETAGKK